MAAVVNPTSRGVGARTVDIAGVQWPMFKLEALAFGVLTCLVLFLVIGSPQVAVLAGAAVAALRWFAVLIVRRVRPFR
jgi:hypothetical protein